MISCRSDFFQRYNESQPKTYDCRLELVFPMDENGMNISDRDIAYMGILQLEIDTPQTLAAQLAIWDKVNTALSPHKATIDDSTHDARKFFSTGTQNMVAFESSSTLIFENAIRRISSSPVTENLSQFLGSQFLGTEEMDRVTISFSVTV